MMATRRTPMTVLLLWSCVIISSAAGVSAQTLNFTLVGSIPGPADMVRVQGAHAFVAAGKTLTVFDLSNPAAPKRGGAYTFPEQIWGFKVIGSLVYVAADLFGLGILDVSNAAAPSLRSSFKTPGQAKGVAVFGTKAVVADHMSGVDYVDLSNLDKPVSLGSFFLDGYARDVAASGPMAYAVDSPTGLYVFDLSKPGPLESVSTQHSATAPGSIQLSDASAAQGPPVAVLVGGGSLQIYDVSNPGTPVKAATYRTPSGRPLRVALKGKLAYVADGREGLQVADLTTPSKPILAGSYKTPRPARDVAVTDSLVFVVVGAGEEDGEILILRQNR
jgi:hypothetical protein